MSSAEAIIDDPAVVVEEKELVRFERADEYISLLSQLVQAGTSPTSIASTSSRLDATTKTPDGVLGTLISILDEYQDQSNLLDPYLECIVSPPVKALQLHVHSLANSQDADTCNQLPIEAVTRLSKLVYAYTKVRGYKTIVHYFPHEVAELPATLAFLEDLQTSAAGNEEGCWELRYVCLLWLSLICMIPFDLAKFDQPGQASTETTASRIAAVANHFITSPGKERDAAAVVLGRLFQRNDVQQKNLFNTFLSTSLDALKVGKVSPFHATGILQALCEILKTSEPTFVVTHLAAIQSIVDACDTEHNAALAGNGLIVKYQTKLVSRLSLKLLRPRARRHANKVHILGSSGPQRVSNEKEEDDDESDIPEEIESFISYLIEALQHKDTVVRYSAAKGLARLCDRLPNSFLDQVVEAIVSLFHINIPDLYNGATDLSSVSEHTWQGACMALAELARRGLLFADMLSEALPWILQALLFDVRRGAHSVGANVRDAACYVVWALARSNDVESIRPHAMDLAKRLVAVATLDRDVSIRRAASAAFQESVGRLGLFAHGIDVIRMTDFYAVSVRRNAFLDCAVKVGGFEEYRGYLVDHLLRVVTVHWDPAMRRLGAQSVALIAMHEPAQLLAEITTRLSKRIETADIAVLHGTLLSLAELCRLSRTLPSDQAAVGERVRAQAFDLLDSVRPSVFRSLGAASILQAACRLIGSGFSLTTVSSENETQTWEKILNLALARHEEIVHTAAAEAVSQLSTSVDLSSKIRLTLDGWSSLTLAQQQSNTLLLGALDFRRHAELFEAVIRQLISLGRTSTKLTPNALYSENIEVRRNAVDSITRAVVGLQDRFTGICTSALLWNVVESMLVGLQDYSTDQRGDVGSWVRLSCIAGLRQILILLKETETKSWLTDEEFQKAIGAMWKQAAERIDHVRHTAGTSVLAVYHAYDDVASSAKLSGYEIVKSTYGHHCLRPFEQSASHLPIPSAANSEEDSTFHRSFRDPKVAFPRLCQLLFIPAYRAPILEGLIISVGSKSDLGERIIGPALTSLPTTSAAYTLVQLLGNIFDLCKRKFGDNRIFIPAIQTVNLLLENGAHEDGMDDILIRLVKMATTNVGKIKSVPRLLASAALCANLILAITRENEEDGREKMVLLLVKTVETFLTHSFPTVRVKMAEQLYAVLSSSASFDEEEGGKLETWQELEMTLLDTKWGAASGVDEATVQSITAALPRLLS
ncbi:hypothetical protein NDA11_001396 [Ustilago hordei]|nr:hypothetical protein NDA15_007879 [Ustilago hordei]KAJ1586514.1 hypothetical protein NDA11_001396 [Ustilago hordei]KAJ1591964.1 hypothetical protein NDA12_004392 [Ustilago hordei]